MKGVFWNCRGLRDLAKHSFLHDVAADNKLDFIALSETNKNSFSTQCLENFSAGADFIWHWKCPRGLSGGCSWVLIMLVLRCRISRMVIFILSLS
jgi:hypothetical protein